MLDAEYDPGRNDFYILTQLDAANRILPINPKQIRSIAGNQSSNTSSYFGHMYYSTNDEWKAELGLRNTFVKKEIIHQISHLSFTVNTLLEGAADWNDFSQSPRISDRIDDGPMLFFRYSHDFRAGGFNDNATTLSPAQPSAHQSVNNFELDLKSEWLDDKLRPDFTLFQNQYDDKLENFAHTAPKRSPADMLFVSSHYSFPYYGGRVNLSAGYRYTNDFQTNPDIPESRVDNLTNCDFAAEYVQHDCRFKFFSQNSNDKRYLQNVRRILDSAMVSLAPTQASQGIVTQAEYNRPRLTGIKISESPTFT